MTTIRIFIFLAAAAAVGLAQEGEAHKNELAFGLGGLPSFSRCSFWLIEALAETSGLRMWPQKSSDVRNYGIRPAAWIALKLHKVIGFMRTLHLLSFRTLRHLHGVFGQKSVGFHSNRSHLFPGIADKSPGIKSVRSNYSHLQLERNIRGRFAKKGIAFPLVMSSSNS
jgi:hypothetical protein